ncbi:MAG: beta-ketoacyl-[acyl-carrier-protein] synthase family protein [Chloroflexi bacterium]|nr:beta-ketoacyl-[acyl-carrier-protein] synthase family protein [Chloroflexota bacterium]
MSRHRVVITGLGIVSTIGLGAAAFAESLKAGRSGISPFQSFDTSGFPYKMGGEVQNFDPGQWLERLAPTTCGRSSRFAAAAARMAVIDAGLDPDVLAQARAGSSVGTTSGESALIDRLTAGWLENGPEGIDSSLAWQIPANRLAISVNRELNLTGEAFVVGTACAAGNYAIGYAYDLLISGEVDYMLCGGADSVSRYVHAGFLRLGAVAPLVCQPFDKNRRGILIGEGAAMLLLETLESATARGARIYAELLGYGMNCDAIHMVAPDATSIATCIRQAQANAGINPEEVDYICAHGTGTSLNDAVETAAIKEVFGERRPPVSALKSMLGHTTGAASAHSAAACALAIHHGFIPPTINFQEPDPQCDVDCVPNASRTATLNVVQCNGFGFGGNNAVIILGRHAWVNEHYQ